MTEQESARGTDGRGWGATLRRHVAELSQYWTLNVVETILVLCVLFAFAYYFGSGSWNQNARMDAIYAFVEPGVDQHTFRINRFLYDPQRGFNTGDWALFEGNFYANKAPGTILIGVLAYLPVHWFETELLDLDPSIPLVEVFNAYWLNLVLSVAFAGAGALFYHRLLERLGVPQRRALLLTLVLFFSTAIFPYSTQLWGVATTATLVIAGYLGLVAGTGLGAAAAGACLGFAVCSDYLAVLFGAMGAIYLALTRRERLLPFVFGGSLPALVLLGYHYYCFGDPFITATSLSRPEFMDRELWLGIFGRPSLLALYQLTFGELRGLFYQMPVLALALPGVWFWYRRAPRDGVLWLAVSSFLVMLVTVAGFNGWHGGATVSARYLIPALPWLCLALKELPGTRAWTLAVSVLAGISFVNMLAIAATNPIASEQLQNPLLDWVYPHFLAGDMGPLGLPTRLQALHPGWREIRPWTCFNLGEVAGLSLQLSHLPFFVVTAGGIWLAFRQCRDSRAQEARVEPAREP